MIINVRIDERLIHGQVATMWTNTLKADRIIVVDDKVVKSDMEKEVLKMAKPNSVKLSILSVNGAAKRIKDGKYDGDKVFLIVKNPRTLVDLVNSGVKIEKINIGNMSTKENSIKVLQSVSVTTEDVEAFQELNEKGIKLYAQMVPTVDPKDFMDSLERVIK